MKRRIVIIGGGVGGLAAAALLAGDFDVELLERAEKPGGKIRTNSVGVEEIDAGPTVFTMPWVFEEIFAESHDDFHARVRLEPLETIARHYWENGAKLDLFADAARSADEIGRVFGACAARNYLNFCRRSARLYLAMRDAHIRAGAPGLARLVLGANPFDLSAVNPFLTLWEALTKDFQEPRLIQLFGRYATYCGSSPYAAPAAMMLIAHVEREGVWKIEGGMSALARALADLATRNGAHIRCRTDVERILVERGRATGVELANGERMEADATVFNGDPEALASGLLGETARAALALAPHRTPSLSAVTLTMSAKASGAALSTHNVFFSDDYRREFDLILAGRGMPERPTAYVFAPNADVSTDRQKLFVLANSSPVDDGQAAPIERVMRSRRDIIEQLNRCGLKLEFDEATATVTTPEDFAKRFPGSRGALYGSATHGWRAPFERPTARTRIPGLYIAGGGAHPGPGIPMAALSGKAAAAAICKDLASTER